MTDRPLTVGIAGRIASGKSLAAHRLVERGFYEIDVDALGHEALTARRGEIVDRFGSAVASSDGAVNRAALGRVVFADPAALRDLEGIVHPYMVRRVLELRDAQAGPVVINAALLFHMKLDVHCDLSIWIESGVFRRFMRTLARDRRGFLQTWRRIHAQGHLNPQPSSPNVDTEVVKNTGSVKAFIRRLDALIDDLLEVRNGSGR